uniref:Uncharacterized protein n=1 Tax=Romanomermis culicivorax TaxID=13658 RepID=A0A915JIB2_ROMCU
MYRPKRSLHNGFALGFFLLKNSTVADSVSFTTLFPGTSSKNTSDDHGGRPKQTPPEMAPTADSTPPPAAAPLPSQQPHVAVNNVEPKSPAQAVPTTFSSVFPSSIAPTRKSGFSRSTVTVESFQLGKKSSIKDKTTANTPHAPKT